MFLTGNFFRSFKLLRNEGAHLRFGILLISHFVVQSKNCKMTDELTEQVKEQKHHSDRYNPVPSVRLVWERNLSPASVDVS